MKYFYLFALLLLLSRCGKDVPAPSYLHISEFTLENNTNVNYGQLTHAFMDVYVYANDDNLLGVFPVPCTIPLNLEGVYQLRLIPAVRKNGQSGAKTRYPFVEHYVETVNFIRLDTVHVAPKTKYYSTTQVWYEDFEDASTQVQSSGLSLTDMVKSNNPDILTPRNGNFFGYVALNSEIFLWDATTSADWALNPNNEAYLEIDFYNTNSIQTGIRSVGPLGINTFQHVLIVAQKQDEIAWKKMYIELKPFLAASGWGSTYKLMMSSILESNLSETFVAIDNIKLVYR
jgi:hypothetical protein